MNNTARGDEEDLTEYDLDHYDDGPFREVEGEDSERTSVFGNIKALAFHEDNGDDPYITLKDNERGELSDEEERDELEILPTDNLILATRVEDEVAHLECYIYEDNADNLYVHHDVMLPATPLCLEWLDIPFEMQSNSSLERNSDKGNFVAIGTMDPDIELWDLDAVDSMYPNAILGSGPQRPSDKSPKRSNKKSRKKNDHHHVDAVLALSANRRHRNLMASASADETVKLWDLNTAKCAKSYSFHSDKVCSLDWNPAEATAMLSGSYDKTVVAADMRAQKTSTRHWRVDSDVEKVAWNPHDPNYFFVSTESGLLHYFDARTSNTMRDNAPAVWRLQAHSAALTSFCINQHIKGFLATGSDDKTVKLWSVSNNPPPESVGPALIVSRELDVGRLFSVDFAPDEEVAYRLAVAGSKGLLKIWDTSTNSAIQGAFGGVRRTGKTGAGDAIVGAMDNRNTGDRVIGLGEGASDDESEESENESSGERQDDEDDEEMRDAGD